MDTAGAKRRLVGRRVFLAFASLVGLWAFNLTSYPIGKPLDPVFRVVFWAFFRFRPTLTESFALELVMYYGWFLVYCYLLAVLLAGLYRSAVAFETAPDATP